MSEPNDRMKLVSDSDVMMGTWHQIMSRIHHHNANECEVPFHPLILSANISLLQYSPHSCPQPCKEKLGESKDMGLDMEMIVKGKGRGKEREDERKRRGKTRGKGSIRAKKPS